MRPLKLTISAFEPYGATEVVDFTKLGEGGIYLITGPTGSGKSAIYDAICFALFGRDSSKNRSAQSFRSSHCTDDRLETRVELDFSVRGEVYHVERWFRVKKTRESGAYESVFSAEATLIYPDGESLSKAKLVNDAIVEILGMDYDQFSQIVMLPQGEFREFLESDSAAKSKIFSKIFDTRVYAAITQRLGARSGEVNKAMKSNEIELGTRLSQIDVSLHQELGEQLNENLDRGAVGARDCIEVARNASELDSARLLEIDTQLGALKEQLAQIDSSLGAAQIQAKAQSSLARAREALDAYQAKMPELTKALEEAQEFAPKLDELRVRIKSLQDSLAKFDEYDKAIAARDSLKQRVDKAIETATSLEQAIANLKSEAAQLKDASVEKAKQEALLEEIKKAGGRVSGAKKSLSEYMAIRKDIAAAIASKEAAEKRHSELSSQFIASQAGLLARELKSGEPCPVCGSTEHPRPATLADSSIDEKAVQRAKSAMDEATKRANAISNEAATKLSAAKLQIAEIDSKFEAMFESQDFEAIGELLDDSVIKMREEYTAANKQLKKLSDDVARATQIESQVANKESQLKDASTALVASRDALSKAEGQVEEKRQSLAHGSKDAVRAEIESDSAELKRMEAQAANAKKAYDECAEGIAKAQTAIEENEKLLDGSKALDVAKLQEEKSAVAGQQALTEREKLRLSSAIKTNASAISDCEKLASKHDELEKKATLLDRLYRTASGEVTGADRISFEIFVQAYFFDQILIAANQRLRMMTDGRYELCRKLEESTKKGKGGLNLEVLDNYTGERRDSVTLSGGESFQASLSLALGLSDIISGSSGGIEIEAMFVDEGFGTLDEDMLQTVLSSLLQITQGDRSVGIISHVELLKEAIEKKVIIEKTSSGSHISVEAE